MWKIFYVCISRGQTQIVLLFGVPKECASKGNPTALLCSGSHNSWLCINLYGQYLPTFMLVFSHAFVLYWMTVVYFYVGGYGDDAGNTVKENSGVLCLIRMH